MGILTALNVKKGRLVSFPLAPTSTEVGSKKSVVSHATQGTIQVRTATSGPIINNKIKPMAVRRIGRMKARPQAGVT